MTQKQKIQNRKILFKNRSFNPSSSVFTISFFYSMFSSHSYSGAPWSLKGMCLLYFTSICISFALTTDKAGFWRSHKNFRHSLLWNYSRDIPSYFPTLFLGLKIEQKNQCLLLFCNPVHILYLIICSEVHKLDVKVGPQISAVFPLNF